VDLPCSGPAVITRVATVRLGPQGLEITGSPQPIDAPTASLEQGVSPAPLQRDEQDRGVKHKRIAEYFEPPYRDLLDVSEGEVDKSLPDFMKTLGKDREETLKHLYVERLVHERPVALQVVVG
jgi:hypothetical protein